MSDKITHELVEKVLRLINEGNAPSAIKLVISEETGFRKTKSNEIYNDIIKGVSFEDDIFDLALDEDDASEPYFNPDSRKYIVFIKCLGRNIVVSEEKHKSILQNYTDWNGEGSTINELARQLGWPRQILVEYLKGFSITKTDLPITNEELAEHDNEELAARLNELRKFAIFQSFEKEDWNSTRADAKKWRSLEFKKLNPFKEVIDNWTPPEYKNIYILEKSVGNNVLLSVLTDLHFGEEVNPEVTYRKLDVDSNTIAQRVLQLADRIIEDAENQGLKEITVLSLGDILNSANSQGTTSRGTFLDNDMKAGVLFKFALDILAIFFDKLLSVGVPIRVFGLTGNHDGALGQGFLYACAAYFRTMGDKITFEVSNRFIDKCYIENSLILFSHGAHDQIRTKVPRADKIQPYAQSLIISAQKEKRHFNSSYLFCGDLHFSSTREMNDLEYILVPSIVGGSNYSDALNLHSRARQQTFLFGGEGIKSTNNYYF